MQEALNDEKSSPKSVKQQGHRVERLSKSPRKVTLDFKRSSIFSNEENVNDGESDIDWCDWEDLDDCDNQSFGDENDDVFIESLPQQLHPAVSLGMRRVSSTYFSIHSSPNNSAADLLSLIGDGEIGGDATRSNRNSSKDESGLSSIDRNANRSINSSTAAKWNNSDVLYHDIMMHVFTYLDAKDLVSYSQVGNQTNFEVFYFLQLQLERALLVVPSNDESEMLAGSGAISRLASLDLQEAKQIVQEYVDSNSTLRTMPLSHSLAYMRQMLRRHGFQNTDASQNTKQTVANAAILITLVGFSASFIQEDMIAAIPNLLKVGLAGSVLRAGVSAGNAAARKVAEEPNSVSMKVIAEEMAQMMHSLPSKLLRQIQHQISVGDHKDSLPKERRPERRRSLADTVLKKSGAEGSSPSSTLDQADPSCLMTHKPLTPNPYEHLPAEMTTDTIGEATKNNDDGQPPQRKMPSGCVGAYNRAVRRATNRVTEIIKEKRKSNFDALPDDDKIIIPKNFLDACTSDATLSVVKELVQDRNLIDADKFYIAFDGTLNNGLHTAVFNGACKVAEFLVKGIDEHSSENDGGLCNVNIRDSNNWTALHYAAGANCVEAVKLLAENGANLTVEASNGYTPYHWALRLSNEEVAEELKTLGANRRFMVNGSWQPLSMIASRFFSRIPSE